MILNNETPVGLFTGRPFHHMPPAESFRIRLSARLSYQDVDHDALSGRGPIPPGFRKRIG